jgi:hypothetical protein
MNYDRLRADLARPGYKPPAIPPPPLLLPIEECPIMVLQTRYCSLLYQTQTKILKVAIERAVADGASLRYLFPARAYFDTQLRVENASMSLDGVNLAGVDLTGAEFGRCSLRNANFKGAKIIAVSFDNADLSADLLIFPARRYESPVFTLQNLKAPTLAESLATPISTTFWLRENWSLPLRTSFILILPLGRSMKTR